jgi:hypothetical protein
VARHANLRARAGGVEEELLVIRAAQAFVVWLIPKIG